ncbi:hypothetical protein AHAS_Ahas01G0123100 [Arachis hypogaea]
MTMYSSFLRCNAADETTLHVLRDSFFSKGIWGRLIPQEYRNTFFTLDLQAWLTSNLSRNSKVGERIFGIVVSSLWYTRILLIFEGKYTSQYALVHSIQARSREIESTSSKLLKHMNSNTNTKRLIGWEPPLQEMFIKIKIDGSFYNHNNNAACGGILRDSLGRFLKGFSCNLGSCSIMHDELWDILVLSRRIQEINWHHNLREENLVADCLAKQGQSLLLGIYIYDSPLPGIFYSLVSDCMGVIRTSGSA